MALVDCNCDYCKFNEDGWCGLDTVQIEAQIITPMGFVPMCGSFMDKDEEGAEH